MRYPVKNIDLEKRIFAASEDNFTDLAIDLFQFQYQNNKIYQRYCDILQTDIDSINTIQKIPFLPVIFFKRHQITTTQFTPKVIFESSGTSQSGKSRHFVKNTSIYHKSFTNSFKKFYGSPKEKCIIGLLPSYLERENSSLIMMVDSLIKESQNILSGFYLYDYEKLHSTLLHNEILKIPTILIGVTYALIDFAEKFPMQLCNTIIMETGGMKGRKKEITRQQVHQILQKQLGVTTVHSEYGMTELLSQAYSKGNGIFHCPRWMRVLLREEDDPFHIFTTENKKTVKGVINVIDFANIYSCSFIATEDIGYLYSDKSFEVIGRTDNSDIRGCGLMLA